MWAKNDLSTNDNLQRFEIWNKAGQFRKGLQFKIKTEIWTVLP
jgi:hypothetical protein